MLSPQDLQTWTVQRFKVLGVVIDIFMNDNPILRKGLTLKQKFMYARAFVQSVGNLEYRFLSLSDHLFPNFYRTGKCI